MINGLKILSKFFNYCLEEVLFPRRCFACGALGDWLCVDCAQRLPRQPNNCCLFCRAFQSFGQVCQACGDLRLRAAVAAFDYRLEPIAQGIKACKYQFAAAVGRRFGQLLADCWQDYLRRPNLPESWRRNWLVVPLPLTAQRYRWRGFNQSALLAKAVADICGYELNEKDFCRLLKSRPQAKLSGEARRFNLQPKTFLWRGDDLSGRRVLLVDDVMTTGATLLAAGTALRQAGAKTVVALVLAHG